MQAAWYSSTNWFLMKSLDKSDRLLRSIGTKIVLGVWGRIVRTAMKLYKPLIEVLQLPISRSWYLLTDCNCSDQTGQNDFEFWKDRSNEFLCYFLSLEIILCQPILYHTQACTNRYLGKICRAALPERSVVSVISVVGGHSYRRRGECGWCESDSLRYSTYFISANYVFKDAMPFGYATNFTVRKSPESKAGERMNEIRMKQGQWGWNVR